MPLVSMQRRGNPAKETGREAENTIQMNDNSAPLGQLIKTLIRNTNISVNGHRHRQNII